MTNTHSAGSVLRAAVAGEQPLQVVGVINALCALLAKTAGFQAIYLSGAGVANASHGLPDLGMTSLEDVVEDARRITAAVDLPLLVDADTGWEGSAGIARTVRELTSAGVAGMHMEDQVDAKRCGHRPGKQLVSADEMIGRIKAAVDARTDEQYVIMARTDAAAVEGLDAAIERAGRYVDAGADMIFAEALTEPQQYTQFTSAVNVPVLANVTEFGKTPLMTRDELSDLGVAIALYPLSAFRAMNAAALQVYETIAKHGTQIQVVDQMQTRDQLYDLLDYHAHEQRINEELAQDQPHGS